MANREGQQVDTLPIQLYVKNSLGNVIPLAVNASGELVVTTASGGADPVGLKNIAASPIDPSTEDKQDDIVTELGNIRTELSIKADLTETQPVSDAGGSLTVDGTVTANLSATDNAVLDTIDAVLDTIKTDTQLIETATIASELTLDTIYTELLVKADPTENQYVAEQNIGIAGAGVEGTVALTTAWQQCPPSGSVPSASYQLWIAKENEAGVVRIATASASSPSVTYGRRMRDNEEVVLAGTAFIYVASSVAGDDINWGTKEIL